MIDNMVQEFHVLRCFSCQTYQVQQVKKSNKWSCNMCGEKQSVIKEFLRGGAGDCRRLVQTLNARRGEGVHQEDQSAWSSWEQKTRAPPSDAEKHVEHGDTPQLSRWKKYLPSPEEEEKAEEEEEADWGWDVNRKHCHGNSVRTRKRRGWHNEENHFSYPDQKHSRPNHSLLNQSRADHTKPNHTKSHQSSTKDTRLHQTRPDQTKTNLSRSRQINQTRPDQTSTTAPSRWSQFLDPPRPCLGDAGSYGASGLKESSLPSDWLKSTASLSVAEEGSNKSASSHTTTSLSSTDGSCQQVLTTWPHPSQLIGSLFNTGEDFDLFDD